MTHLDESVLVAIRDGEDVPEDERRHAEACATCRETLGEAARRARVIDEMLSSSDLYVDTEAAKAAVRARLDAHRTRRRTFPVGYRSLRRAAAILLVTAGAAYALPRSPVPAWLGLERSTPSVVETGGPGGQEVVTGGGIEVAPGPHLDVVLTEVSLGSEVELVWHDGPSARVDAAAGSAYVVSEGRLGVRVAEGPVVVSLPRSAPSVSISINGRMVFTGNVDASQAWEVARQSADGVVFAAPSG